MVYKMHKLSTNTLIFSLKEFLPKEYIKQRGSEKKIFQVCIKVYTVKKQKYSNLSAHNELSWKLSNQTADIWIYSINVQDHKNCGEMTEIEAKVKYVKLARSLRTYGVSFFLVKVREARFWNAVLNL